MSHLPVFEQSDHPKGGRTYLDDVLPLVVNTLSRILRPDDDWKTWAPVIKDYDGEAKYRMADIRLLERERNPVESMWSAMTRDARDLNYVKDTLTQASLFYAADFISVNVLRGEKVRRPTPRQDFAPSVRRLEEPPAPIVPDTAMIGRTSSGTLTDSSSASTDVKDLHDGMPVQYNNQMDYPNWNIENSGEFGNLQQGTVRAHELHFREAETVYSRKPVNEGNVQSAEPPKNELQQKIISEIDKVLAELADVQLEPGKPHEFQYKDLSSVTQNFDKRLLSEQGRLIGKGGFGEVFLGVMHNKSIAVKRIKNTKDRNVAKQFKAEVDAMSWLVHVNLLPLLGYSADESNLCIVYEYMTKGSLEDALACKNNEVPLSIKQRLDIALGTTRGIAHLHSRDPPLVHRDIKSANVLLSEDLTPRIGDFGLARLGPQPRIGCTGGTHIITADIIGTTAYMPPEAYEGEIAPRWDCYSLGVVILELVTSLPAYDNDREERLLPNHITEMCDNVDDFLKFVDNKAGTWDVVLVSKMYELTTKCLARKSKRWNITQIEEVLSASVC